MITKLDLQIKTNEDLARLLGEDLVYIQRLAKEKWSHIRYQKKLIKDKLRDLYVADKFLGPVHKKIDSLILDKIDFPKEIKGGIKGRSRASNASLHQNGSNVAHFDIKNFFPNTSPRKVYLSFRSIGISSDPAKLLVRLVTVDHLAQGFATSTKVSAMVLLKTNMRLQNFLIKTGTRHTIWVDDIVLSGKYPLRQLKSGVKTILKEEGYLINDKKTSIRYKNEPQIITGIIVNQGLSASRVVVKDLRRIIYICEKYGIPAYLKMNLPNISMQEFKNKMAGNLGNLISINKEKYSKDHKKWMQICQKV